MHDPVHPHSQNSGRTSDRGSGQRKAGSSSEPGVTERGGDTVPPATGPFSGSAENGYRPSSRVSVPNPYTTRRVDVDDVDTGATPVGQWRGVGLDEPEPRTPPITATTETMTDTSSTERAERPEAPAAQTQATPAAAEPPLAQRPEQPGQQQPGQPAQTGQPEQTAQSGQGGQHRSDAPRPQAPRPEEPVYRAAPGADAQQAASQRFPATQQPAAHPAQGAAAAEAHQQPPQGWAGPAPQPHQAAGEYPAPSAYPQVQGQHGYPQQPGAAPAGHDPYAAHGAPYQAAPGAPYGVPPHPAEQYQQPYPYPPQAPQAPRPEGYPPAPPQHGGYAQHPQAQPAPYPPQPAHYPAPYPPQPLVTYQSAYPPPFQPPGYVLQGQPFFYPGQYNPYGQPVQHVIVLAAGQQPQVISAESASTLFAEQAESPSSAHEDARGDKALTRADSEEKAEQEGKGEKETGKAAEPAEAEPVESAPEPAASAEPTPPAVGAASAEEAPAPPPDGRHSLLNEALAGLAMRDLSLVDALLEMVEDLETDAKDPDLLDKLFQIDNFATRMRRNGENFLVLTGHDGGESDAHDEIVPLLDVARAATSEIKDYPRVQLGKIPQSSITGMAADDISHLLAELLDNATANSPEHSQVVVSAQEMNDGRLMIVVEDEGVGIPESQLAELNDRLAGDPVLDDEVPRHMGLYVASRIARKHGLETRLESRSFRGVSAYAIIPKELLRVATPRTPGQSRTSTVPTSVPTTPVTPSTPPPSVNGGPKAPPPQGGTSTVTSAGLPRRSATPHGSPLRMMPHPKNSPDTPPQTREDTPPKLTGEARAEQIRDELGDFFDGEREAREGDDESKGDEK